jgi:hypothetical protein
MRHNALQFPLHAYTAREKEIDSFPDHRALSHPLGDPSGKGFSNLDRRPSGRDSGSLRAAAAGNSHCTPTLPEKTPRLADSGTGLKVAFRSGPWPASRSSGATLSRHGAVRSVPELPPHRDPNRVAPRVTRVFRPRGRFFSVPSTARCRSVDAERRQVRAMALLELSRVDAFALSEVAE